MVPMVGTLAKGDIGFSISRNNGSSVVINGFNVVIFSLQGSTYNSASSSMHSLELYECLVLLKILINQGQNIRIRNATHWSSN